MIKRIIALLLVFVVCVSFCACTDNKKNETKSDAPSVTKQDKTQKEKTPEEIAEDFVRAMYCGDVEAFVNHIPEFTYDTVLTISGTEAEEGADKEALVREYFESVMAEEPEDLATEINIETKRSDTMNKDTYFDDVKENYISEGLVSEEDFEKIEDVVFVLFNCNGKYASGEEFALTDFESYVPCIKIDGKWYVDFLYLIYVPVKMETYQAETPIP